MFAINTIGPALVAKHFLPKLRRKQKTVFATLSARVGSINDNRLGGWASYRMSKAALNMLVRTIAIEQARSAPETVVVALHPGTVDTQLSKPFTKRVDASQLFSPECSAKQLLQVIDRLQAENSGGFYAYDHARIEY
jgi:NAD(P)-dependent dehydrogenase (short-subunit alcohol dehydrogenase family)